jgi:TolA-binding protein
MGRLKDAADLLDEKATAPSAPNRSEAIFTRAAILQALGNTREALDALTPLITDATPAIAERARLKSAGMLLNLDQPADALAMLPADKSIKDPAHVAEALLLRGRALLAKHDNKTAITLFSSLLEREDAASRLQQQDAATGLAQAQLEAGRRNEAADGLLAFLSQNKTLPRLGPVFAQLYLCLPPEGDVMVNDTILTKLMEWIPPAAPRPTPGLLADASNPLGDGSASVWPTDFSAPMSEFNLQAIFYGALGLRREGSHDSKSDARQLLNRLRIEYPNHPLALQAVWEMAIWDLADGRTDEATLALEGLQRISANDPGAAWLKVSAQLTEAREQFLARDFAKAAATLQEASASLSDHSQRLAKENAAAALLAADNLPAFDALAKSGNQEQLESDLALERALYLASRRDPEGIKALDRFIMANPDHPRLAEARLASAHAALEAPLPDLALARAQLESIPPGSAVPQGSMVLARIRVATRSGDWAGAVDLAQDFLKTAPDDPRQEEVTFELGNARFQNRDYNAAQLAFQGLVAAHPGSPLAQLAQFWAARSAALGVTTQAKEKSIGLFDKVIAAKGPLAELARIYKADVQIVLGKLSDAITALDPWVKSMKKDDPLRMSAGLLLGDALYASGELDRALSLYSDLLADLPADSPRRFQLKYRSGQALEKKGEAGKALDAYYSVLSLARTAKAPASDWQWVDNCGLGARRLLEDAHKWDAAIHIAKEHARLPSPGAKEAGERARILGLEHGIMDDDSDSQPPLRALPQSDSGRSPGSR